jgi:hypothetical protein
MIDRLKLNIPQLPEYCQNCNLKVISKSPFCIRCKSALSYESVGPIKSGKCIYCEYNGILTKEHIFPKWITHMYPRRHKKTYHHFVLAANNTFFEDRNAHVRTNEVNKDLYDTTVYNVCSGCNGGWMSSLQNQAKRLIVEFANGEWPKLTKTQCEFLSRWATMVSINLQSYAKTELTNEADRLFLKQGEMPKGWRVYVAKLASAEFTGKHFNRTGYAPKQIGENKFLPFNISYFCIERVLFCTVSTLNDNMFEYLNYSGIGLHDHDAHMPLRRIWPENFGHSKTKNLILDDMGLKELESYFGITSENVTKI